MERRQGQNNSLPVIAIVGPTATGKTALALALSDLLKAEIVSADSMQIYRFMDIGTAKPPWEIRKRVPHHFIDILNPDETYSAGLFGRQAHRLILEKRRKHIPLVIVGGTGLYIKALEKGLVTLPDVPEKIETHLWDAFMNEGLPALYERLKRVDPPSAAAIHPHDRFRIMRALGVYEATGTPLSSFHKHHQFRNTLLPIVKIGLTYPREILYKRIEARVDQMIKNGWPEEVEALLHKGYDETLKPMQAIGYKQLTCVVKGKKPLREAIEEIKKETRHLAKRQITWFKKEPPHIWLRLKGNRIDREAKDLVNRVRQGDIPWKQKEG